MCNGQNGHRHLGALHILYQQQPTDLDRRFIEIRQWLTAEGDYSDLIVEQGLLQDDDLQTKTTVMPFHYSAEQALDWISGRKAR
jgi:hypothetical protein